MCNVPTSQVHAWNGGSGGFLSGSTELKDPSSFNLVKACRSSHVGCHVVTRDVWLGLTLPHHVTSSHITLHHVTSFRVDMSKGSSQVTSIHITGFHWMSPAVTFANSNSSIDAGVGRESTATSWWGAPCDTVFRWPSSSCCSTPQSALRGHEIPWDTNIIQYLESLFIVWLIFYNKL